VLDDGTCAAGSRVYVRSRWPGYRFASNGQSDGDGSVGNEAEAGDTDPSRGLNGRAWRRVRRTRSQHDDRRRGQQIVQFDPQR
jgi:hypothetical protein